MAKKKQKRGNEDNNRNEVKKNPTSILKTETRHGIMAIVFFVLALFLFMSAFGVGGVAGKTTYKMLYYVFGIGYALIPVLFLLLGTSYLKSEKPEMGYVKIFSSVLFLLSGLSLINIITGNNAEDSLGGFLGKILASPLVKLFDVYAAFIFLVALVVISISIMFDTRPDFMRVINKILNLFRRKNKNEEDEEEEVEEEIVEEEEEEIPEKEIENKKEKIRDEIEPIIANNKEEELPIKKIKSNPSSYVPPPLSLLEEDKGKPNTGDIKANSNIIKRTLMNFGIEVEMDEVTIGPTVTRYALKPAQGVKLSKIVGLQNDLALALAAHPLRIEAPIPGKSLVGIEIPNRNKSTVGLGTLLKDPKFQHSPNALTLALGRSISGKTTFGNLAKMPHCLVAGTTGSGKSVTIHTMITSLLYRNGPDDLKFIFVDPKRVELTLYKNIPHLLTPVITDAKKAILALKWAAKEMDRRYDILEAESVRDISSYHNNVANKRKDDDKVERMPYIVIIIDELADIMTTYPRELEAGIVRLAQMSRAVGIHLVLSTQRPEVNVITGLIKANVPARIALKVSSQIDSRTILDTGGAEKLLGAGDMLYSSGEGQPERVQSAFVTEREVKSVVEYLANAYQDEINAEINLTTESVNREKGIFESTIEDDDEIEDTLYEEARMILIEAGKGSTSYLQRKLKLGYNRAARLMDMLEKRGVVGPQDGSKPREVLIKNGTDENGDNVM